ncbi:MAG TPA: DUF2750 domain-containing protein [Psychromonas hadalis]|nr:DUF2750 domain-containing protein [Psychromonas hadalis]
MKEQYLKNAETFVTQASETSILYGLFDVNNGWANCHAHDNDDAQAVYLFWSEEKQAKKLQNEEWADYQVTEIELDVFLDSWLDGMQNQHVFAGVNWDENLFGLEIEAAVLKNSLIEESTKESKETASK